jgi:four helix bundle protein
MSRHHPTPSGKPYDIRERLFEFACDVIRTAQKLHHQGPIAGALSVQLVSAAVSAASNAEEADDGSSDRDFRAKDRICLREIKETRLRLRILRSTGFLDGNHDPLVQEAHELVLIVSTIIRNNEQREAREKGDR